jgi:hypothetical protein
MWVDFNKEPDAIENLASMIRGVNYSKLSTFMSNPRQRK